jgi:hypothetical protein
MPYLICERCKGYYELQKGESEDDFLECECGGKLFFTEELENTQFSSVKESYLNLYTEEDNQEHMLEELDETVNPEYKGKHLDEIGKSRTISVNKLSFFVLIFLMISVTGAASFSNLFQIANNSSPVDHSIIGSNDKGHVNKYVYAANGSQTTGEKNIAIVTGIHPREHLSKAVWIDVLNNYHVPNNTEIVQYDINVDDSPNDFAIGRNNGENLAATYILPDILKSKYDLVIVCHDHQPGYGEGFFFATPKMDDNSVKFTETLTQRLPFFNYYRSSGTDPAASNVKFTIPIASNGYRAIVYEIPGLNSYSEAYTKTSELLDASIQII